MSGTTGRTLAITGAKGLLGQALLPLLGPSVQVLTGDVRLAGSFAARFDGLIHLAGALPHRFQEDFATALAVNVEGTRRALEACRANGAGMVLASTSGVYAPTAHGIHTEEAALDPSTPYGMSKLLAEALCRLYQKRYGLPVRILRIFNLYGPGQTADLLPGYLVRQAMAGLPIRLRTPEAGRDFIHVVDVARAFHLAALDGRSGMRVYNVGSGLSHRVGDWVPILAQQTGRRLEVITPPEGEEHVGRVIADITRIRTELGWNPTIDLEAGIASMVIEQVG